jgi:hypothetical protein
LAAARKQRTHLALAKLDRLSRDVHFISGLMAQDEGINVRAQLCNQEWDLVRVAAARACRVRVLINARFLLSKRGEQVHDSGLA